MSRKAEMIEGPSRQFTQGRGFVEFKGIPWPSLFFWHWKYFLDYIIIPEVYLLISEILEKEENNVPYSKNLEIG